MALHGLGDVSLVSGDLDSATGFYLDALGSSTDPAASANCLAGLAAVGASRGQVEAAGRAWGALESYLERLGERVILPQTLRRYEAAIGPIDGEAFAAAAADGRRLTFEAAAREALEAFSAGSAAE